MKVITGSELAKLENAEIVTIKGISGIKTDTATAKQAPQLVEIHAMSGKVYSVLAYIVEIDQFNVEQI